MTVLMTDPSGVSVARGWVMSNMIACVNMVFTQENVLYVM